MMDDDRLHEELWDAILNLHPFHPFSSAPGQLADIEHALSALLADHERAAIERAAKVVDEMAAESMAKATEYTARGLTEMSDLCFSRTARLCEAAERIRKL